MFSGISYQQPNQKGKRISGYQAKKSSQTGSILSWDVNQNFNHVQRSKTRGRQITGKVNGQVYSQQHQQKQQQELNNWQRMQMNSQHSNTHQQQQKQISTDPQTALRNQYERIIRQNPNISQEQLDALLYDFQRRQYQKQRQRQKQKQKQTTKKRVVAQQVLTPSRGSYSYDRRTPIKPKQQAKGVIYGVSNQQMTNINENRTQSRKNNSNLVLGDGYNYFKDARK